MAVSAIFDPRPTPYFDQNGNLAVGALAYFFKANTDTQITVYTDPDLATPHPWPVVAGSNGTFPPIYMAFGDYRVVIRSADGILLFDAESVSNPAPPSAGGGVQVDATQIFQTGDMVARLRSAPMSGFVRMNGATLGGASSGATEYAAAGAMALFSFLWNGLDDTIATVSGGRGASAAADFSANKTIIIPSMQGAAFIGADDMGATPAKRIQTSTTCAATGTNVVTVADATGIAVGQSAIVNGLAAGAVTAISGLSITLSVTIASGTGLTFRSSFFTDAQKIGALAGAATVKQTSDQLAAHNHPVTDPGHTHNAYVSSAAGTTPLAQATNGTQFPSPTSSSTTGISIGNTGGGNPMSILQPSRLGTWYMKL